MSKLSQPAARVSWMQALVGRLLPRAGGAVMLVMALVVVQDIVQTRRSASSAAMVQMTMVAQARESEILRWIQTQRETLNVMAGSRTAQRWAEFAASNTPPEDDEIAELAILAHDDLLHLLISVSREQPGIREVSVLRAPDGIVALSSNAARLQEVRGADVAYVQGLLAPYVGKAQTSATTGRTVMPIAAPLYDESGIAVAVMVVDLDLDWVQRTMLSRDAFAPTWERYLVDRGFRLIVGPAVGQASRPALWDEAIHFIRDQGISPRGGAGIYRNYRDVRVIGAYRWIGATDLALVVEADLAEVIRAERSWVIWAGPVVIGAVLLGLVSSGVLLMLNQVTRPLMGLGEQVLQVADGNLESLTIGRAGRLSKVAEVRGLSDAVAVLIAKLEGRYRSLEARAAARTEELRQRSMQLQAAAGVSSAVASIREVQGLLDELVHLLPHYFDFDHVGIFLTDDRGEAVVLQAASSEGGLRMLARGHRLALGQGIVGAVAHEGQPRIALDVGDDPVFFNNPDLPNTRSEMALPLLVREQDRSESMAQGAQVRVFGVLDVQSERPSAFTDEDVIVFQSVADQAALAIENARLLEESDRILRELQMRYGEQVTTAWKRPLLRMNKAYRYTGSGVVPVTTPESASDTVVSPQAQFSERSDGSRELVASIIVRGEVLGSVTLCQDVGEVPWDEQTLNLVEMVCVHIGEALENARLLDDAQVRAGYEQLTGDIAKRIRASAVDMDEVLRTTLHELGAALGATGSITVSGPRAGGLRAGHGNGGETR